MGSSRRNFWAPPAKQWRSGGDCPPPAADCDVDHTIPYAEGGPTHASNLKCYCRTHHLVKTFWGWRDQQLPDGTVIILRYTPRRDSAGSNRAGGHFRRNFWLQLGLIHRLFIAYGPVQ